MNVVVASGAKGYEIPVAVTTCAAAKLNVMNLQFARSSTLLTTPIISF
jgi:hypothetical protein